MDSVTIAASYARQLVETEAASRGVGLKEAIRPVARQLKASDYSVWALLFKKPKRITTDLFDALAGAIEKQIIRDIQRLENELAVLRATARISRVGTVAEAQASLARLKAALRGGEG